MSICRKAITANDKMREILFSVFFSFIFVTTVFAKGEFSRPSFKITPKEGEFTKTTFKIAPKRRQTVRRSFRRTAKKGKFTAASFKLSPKKGEFSKPFFRVAPRKGEFSRNTLLFPKNNLILKKQEI